MDEIIAATIAASLAFVAGLIVNSEGRFQFFSTIVSAERMAWIKEIRNLAADLCTLCEQYNPENLSDEHYAEFLKARNGILVRLDPKGWYTTDDELIELLDSTDFGKVKANLPRIREIIMTINKSEWDKVKIEAGNSAWKVWRIKSLQRKLKSNAFRG